MADYTLKYTGSQIDVLLDKVGNLENYDDTEIKEALGGKVDKVAGKGLSTEDYTTIEKAKLAGIASDAQANVQADWGESDSASDSYIMNKPSIPAAQVNSDWNASTGVAAILNKPTIPTTAADVGALPDTTLYGLTFELSINSSTYVVTATLKDQNGDILGTAQTIDLPLESVVVSGSYDDSAKKVILTLQSGSTVDFSVADLVSGLQDEITSANKLSADLVDDTSSAHKFITASRLTKLDGITALTDAEIDIIMAS